MGRHPRQWIHATTTPDSAGRFCCEDVRSDLRLTCPPAATGRPDCIHAWLGRLIRHAVDLFGVSHRGSLFRRDGSNSAVMGSSVNLLVLAGSQRGTSPRRPPL